jgi:spore coat polysaccharide biosynthesis protein SpsF
LDGLVSKDDEEIVAIVQARMGSTRLPGKVMASIVEKPMLWHIIERVKKSKLIDDVLIATTLNKEDDVIECFSAQNRIGCFRGSENDVLDRYYQVAKVNEIRHIVRITADNPFQDPHVNDEVIKIYLENNVDFVSNVVEKTYPNGLNVEVFSFQALEKAWKEARTPYEREHVTQYIFLNPTKFKVINVRYDGENLSHLRWTVDTEEDLTFARTVYQKLYQRERMFYMDDILKLLREYPNLLYID